MIITKHTISAAEFAMQYQQGNLDGAQIIDVRELYEWEAGHLQKATLIPMNTIPDLLNQLSSSKDIYLVCAHGVRSLHVLNYLVQNGITNVINVEGGMAELMIYLE